MVVVTSKTKTRMQPSSETPPVRCGGRDNSDQIKLLERIVIRRHSLNRSAIYITDRTIAARRLPAVLRGLAILALAGFVYIGPIIPDVLLTLARVRVPSPGRTFPDLASQTAARSRRLLLP
jgi:hypothetical protein